MVREETRYIPLLPGVHRRDRLGEQRATVVLREHLGQHVVKAQNSVGQVLLKPFNAKRLKTNTIVKKTKSAACHCIPHSISKSSS